MRTSVYHPLKYVTLCLLFCVSIFDVTVVKQRYIVKRATQGEPKMIPATQPQAGELLILSGKTGLP